MNADSTTSGAAQSDSQITISVVIPTRNRPRSLSRALQALVRQQRLPDEVIVVDASDQPAENEVLRHVNGAFTTVVLRAPADLCAQRNLGIRRATGSHVLLCDDDVEPPPDYLRRLADWIREQPSVGAVTGVLCEPDGSGGFTHGFSAPSVRHLLFAFVFQLTVWADVNAAGELRPYNPLLAVLIRWYRHRHNTWSLAGWPLVTQIRRPAFDTAVYGLGAALVRRDWLLASPYDERLHIHGIGDNYGVALGFPGERSILVLTGLSVRHHRAAANRPEPADAYYARVLALHYFMRTSDRFSRLNIVFLAWSLVGKAILFAFERRGDMLRRTVRALATVTTGRNPLVRGEVDQPAPEAPYRGRA